MTLKINREPPVGGFLTRSQKENPSEDILGAKRGRSKRLFSASAALLLPRIVLWIHVIDILRAYTMNLDDGFFASPSGPNNARWPLSG